MRYNQKELSAKLKQTLTGLAKRISEEGGVRLVLDSSKDKEGKFFYLRSRGVLGKISSLKGIDNFRVYVRHRSNPNILCKIFDRFYEDSIRECINPLEEYCEEITICTRYHSLSQS